MGRILSSTPMPAPPASQSSTSRGSPDSAAPTDAGNFNPLLAVVVSVIIISFFVIGFSSGYIRRWVWGSEYEAQHTELMRRRRMHARRAQGRRASSKPQRGLNPEIVAAIPLVRYKDLPAGEREEKLFDCSVCLAAFDATDSLKLLPQCFHAFHSECIDEWFRSRSTCPLCRVSLDPSAGKSSSRGVPRNEFEGDNGGVNRDGIRVPADFDVVEVDGDGAISGFISQGETPTVSTAPTADTSAGREGHPVDPRPIVSMKTGEFSSFVPAIRVGISPAKAALASIRRSSSESTDLQLLRHSDYVVDCEGTQHHRNFQVHAKAIDAQDQGHGFPTLRLVSLSGSSPNLRQI